MPIIIDVSEAPQCLRFTLIGPWPTIAEQRDLRVRLVNHQLLTSTTRALIDLRLVDSVPAYTDANAIVAAAGKDGGLPRIRAYLVGSAVQFGFARQLKTAAAAATHIEIFSSEEEALVWLWNTDAHS